MARGYQEELNPRPMHCVQIVHVQMPTEFLRAIAGNARDGAPPPHPMLTRLSLDGAPPPTPC
jgi:hypothetical protein